MADLKIGTTIGGSAIWTKGSLPLVPSSNTLTYNGYKLYSEYDKPTPAELGVYAKSETYSKTEVNELGKLRVLDIRDTNKTPSEYPDKILSTFFNSSSVSGALPLTATWYSGFTVKGWTNGYASWQIASMSNTGASDNKLWFRASQSDTTWGTWGRIYTEFDKPTASDVRALPVSGQALNDTVLGVRRLNKTIAFEVGQDSVPYISVDLAYRALAFNPADKAASFPAQVFLNGNKRILSESDYNTSSEWANIVNKLPLITSTGVMEVGKYIDFHETNSSKDYDVRITCVGSAGSECLNIRTANGEVEIGAKNASAAHFYTDRGFIAFNKPIQVSGTIQATVGSASGSIGILGRDNRQLQMEIHSTGLAGIAFKNAGGDWKYPLGFNEDGSVAIGAYASWKAENGSGSFFNLRNWGNSGRANVFECGDQHGWHWYTQRLTNVSGGTIQFSVNGQMRVPTIFVNGLELSNPDGASIRINSPHGYVDIGPKNSGYCHIYTNRPSFVFDKGIYLNPTNSTSWLDMRTSNQCYSTLGAVNTSSASAIVRQEHADRHFILGGLGNSQFGIYMINKSRSTNGTDASAYLQSDGTWVCNGNGNFNDVYIRSDKRLKSNIELTTNHLEKILKLKPVAYDKKATLDAETTERELGLIAQDVEKIIPLAVGTGSDEHKIKALKPYALIATLIGAVQEQQKQIDELKAMLNK